MDRMTAEGIAFTFDPQGGVIRDLVITDTGRPITPLHRAPWADSRIALPPDAPPHQAWLQGDFFCAPFGDAASEGAPLHGWPANGRWAAAPPHRHGAATHLTATLLHPVKGARLTKDLWLRDGHPFLYQRHSFAGGQGALPVANHAMVALPNGGHLRFSLKRVFQTGPVAPETDPSLGRSALCYPGRSLDPRSFPGARGEAVDLTRYPFGPAHEDFVIAIEAPGHRLGWTAITRPKEGDLFLSLRNARSLPMTMLWHSNGGRDYAPWSSRHTGCLGVEEGIAFPLLGLPTEERDQNALLQLDPAGTTRVNHVIGAIDWPTGSPVAAITAAPDHLHITGEDGSSRVVPFDTAFLGLS